MAINQNHLIFVTIPVSGETLAESKEIMSIRPGMPGPVSRCAESAKLA
jgi:hypothetical protein